MESKLRPDAPVYIPMSKTDPGSPSTSTISTPSSSPTVVKSQCSRYSRRSIRQPNSPQSPRPILGTKPPFPRPIVGRKEECVKMEDEMHYPDDEYRPKNKNMQQGMCKEEKTSKVL